MGASVVLLVLVVLLVALVAWGVGLYNRLVTLRNRFKGTVAENNLRAKTGTLSTAASLSGYVTTAAGEELIFSIIVNNYPDGTSPVGECIDPIALLLASFAEKSS